MLRKNTRKGKYYKLNFLGSAMTGSFTMYGHSRAQQVKRADLWRQMQTKHKLNTINTWLETVHKIARWNLIFTRIVTCNVHNLPLFLQLCRSDFFVLTCTINYHTKPITSFVICKTESKRAVIDAPNLGLVSKFASAKTCFVPFLRPFPFLLYPLSNVGSLGRLYCVSRLIFSLKVQTRQWNCASVATCNCGAVVRDHNDVIEFTICSDSLRYNEITPIRYRILSRKCLSPGVSIKSKIGGRSVDYEVRLVSVVIKNLITRSLSGFATSRIF